MCKAESLTSSLSVLPAVQPDDDDGSSILGFREGDVLPHDSQDFVVAKEAYC